MEGRAAGIAEAAAALGALVVRVLRQLEHLRRQVPADRGGHAARAVGDRGGLLRSLIRLGEEDAVADQREGLLAQTAAAVGQRCEVVARGELGIRRSRTGRVQDDHANVVQIVELELVRPQRVCVRRAGEPGPLRAGEAGLRRQIARVVGRHWRRRRHRLEVHEHLAAHAIRAMSRRDQHGVRHLRRRAPEAPVPAGRSR